jgi:putative tryptophan/tyrosine transport system substrate-binding protein
LPAGKALARTASYRRNGAVGVVMPGANTSISLPLMGSDGLLVVPSAMFWNNQAIVIGTASTARVPAIYPEREYVDDGGLIAYGPNVIEHFRQAAGYVDRILRGVDPGDLPINATTKFDFLFNLRTARALRLTPSPTFLSTVDTVIE